MDEKKELRRLYINKRYNMSTDELTKKSNAVFERLCSMKEYKDAAVILAYMSCKNEVITGAFIEKCLSDGKRVALPRVEAAEGAGRLLRVYEIRNVSLDVKEGFKGIPEPDPSCSDLLGPDKIDLAVIPGVAFDTGGNRLGYGTGYYDMFLPLLRADCMKAGIAFELQIADKLPAEEHDFRLDMIITEIRSIKCGNGIITSG